ncbi:MULTISPECIES: hypothetical protein [Sphingomonas]|uniref:hypothetical protein n=1 Tax=Sphingomonas TaxID=13687 RepID=UPI0012E1703E|nr:MULTISPECIES: hypothetical protein [Sphingomonas]MDY0966130.1 hypothetical protein [Sphingomonas sp. CFBP9021]USQ99814.1 hypothetical protein NEF64_15605 [Sphingomonas aerolata]
MTDNSPAERVLSGFLRVILDQHFNSEERKLAAAALRSGDITECVLKYLDYGTASSPNSEYLPIRAVTNAATEKASSPKPERRMESLTVNQLFDLIRKKKISRGEVFNIISRIDESYDFEMDSLSLRMALSKFKSLASDVQWQTLFRIVNGDIDEDPYVASILRHR